MMVKCCEINCTKPATFGIQSELRQLDIDYTYSCSEHLVDMLDDSLFFVVTRLQEDVL